MTVTFRASLRVGFVALACAAGSLGACASHPPPVHVRLVDLGAGAGITYDGRAPLVVELAAGDRLPVRFSFASDDFALEPDHPQMVVVAKRHCFVRFASDGIRTSLDGETFDSKPRRPGSFRVGLSAAPGADPHLDVAVATPQR